MTKLIFALHAADLDSTLRTEGLRSRLAAVGADLLQVNLDDAEVAGAALRFGPSTPITAVLGVWTSGEVDPVVAVVTDLDPTADGWQVEERRPLVPPVVPDGVRADALANVAFLRRPASMTAEQWRSDWLDRHTTVAIETQGTFGYVQNPVVRAVTPDAPPVAGIVEELFPMAAMADSHAFYGSGGDQAELDRRLTRLMDSVARFGADKDLDLVPSSRYVWRL